MTSDWTTWKPFPHPRHGGTIEAPSGPGLYEVRDSTNNAMVAFAPSGSVAGDLARFIPGTRRSLLARLFSKPLPVAIENLEYRTWAAATLADAQSNANRLRGRREVYMRRRNTAWSVA